MVIERPCISYYKCGDTTLNDNGLCRDCGIQQHLDSMACTGCNRMRYREDDATGPLPGLAAALWGDRCECPEPRPPTVYDREMAEMAASS